MIYEFKCEKCLHNFEVVRPARESHIIPACENCGNEETTRIFSSRIHHIGAKVQNAEFNHGLGCVVRNKDHRKEIANRKGLVEVGNETPDTLYKESVIKKEEQRAKEWKEL